MADDDILARIPDLMEHASSVAGAMAFSQRQLTRRLVASLEAAQARIAKLEMTDDIPVSIHDVLAAVQMMGRQLTEALERAEKAEAERDQLRDELKQPHQAAVLRAKQAEAEAARYRAYLQRWQEPS